MRRYRMSEVVRLTGLSRFQIRRAEDQGHVHTGRPRPNAQYRYTADEIVALCEWFGYTPPDWTAGNEKAICAG